MAYNRIYRIESRGTLSSWINTGAISIAVIMLDAANNDAVRVLRMRVETLRFRATEITFVEIYFNDDHRNRGEDSFRKFSIEGEPPS